MATGSSRDALGHGEDIQHYKDALQNSEQLQKLLQTQNETLKKENQNLRDQLSSKIVDQSSPPHLKNQRKELRIEPLVLGSLEPRIIHVLDDLEISLPDGEGSDIELLSSFLS